MDIHLGDCIKQARGFMEGSIMEDSFTSSLDQKNHPMIKTRKKTRLLYYTALASIVTSCTISKEYMDARLTQYHTPFFGEDAPTTPTPANHGATIRSIMDDFMKPWKRVYGLLLLCDASLVLLDDAAVIKAYDMMTHDLGGRKKERFGELLGLLHSDGEIPPAYAKAENLIVQFRANRQFASQPLMRIMVTANMSAGKSTLINALVGKPLMRTAQEATTANLCYIYNKAFEDNRLHLLASPPNLDATVDDLRNIEKTSETSLAAYFRTTGHSQKRICLIDTPGVNFALNSSHGDLTRNAITEGMYDMLIYVLDATKIAKDDEIKYLQYVHENVPNEKVIFVLNKLDCFKSVDDSISASIDGVKADLVKIGFEDPAICPMSAYFSLLLKLKQHGEELDEDDQEVYDYYVNKFRKPEYDLSKYYSDKDHARDITIQDEFVGMSYISGLFGLERIIYGG